MSTNRAKLRTRPAPAAGRQSALRRPAQLVIWLLFAAVAITGLISSGNAGTPSAPSAAVSVSAGSEKGTGSDQVQSANLAAPELAKYGVAKDGKGGTVVLNADAPLELLPAYRWRDDVNLVSDLGWRDLPSAVGSGVGGGLFLLAGFLWSALLLVMRFGLTTNLVTDAAASINSGFAGLANSIGTSGLLAVIAVMVIVAAIGAFFRANLPKALALVLMFVVPIGAMQALAATASQKGAMPAYSPAGLAVTGSNTINSLGEKLATGFNTTNNFASGARVGQYTANDSSANCDYYMARLYATYAAASSKNGLQGSLWATKGGNLSPEELKSQLTTNSGLTTVSFLWQKAFLTNWQTAQFGSTEEGQYMGCHRLELNNNTSANEQFLIAAGNSKQMGPARDTDTITSGPYQGFTRGPFLPTPEEKDGGQVAMFLWAACANSHGASARPGWKDLSGDAAMKAKADGKDVGPDGVCAAWRSSLGPTPSSKSAYEWVLGKLGVDGLTNGPGGKGSRPLDFKDPGALARATTPAASSSVSEETSTSMQHVEQAVRGYWGLNPGQRAVSGLLALITSGLYLWALGAMAVGAIVAQVGLVVMLVAFPITLLLLALPGSGKRGRHPAGLRMLRLTGGFMAAKLVLIFSLTLLIQLIALLEQIVGSGNPIISALMPLGALFGLRAILKSVGLGDITKLGGALAMSGAGGALMAGDKKTAGMLQRGLDPKQQAKNLNDWSNNTLAGRTTKRLAKYGGQQAVAGAGKVKAGGARLGDFAASERERKKQNVLAQAADGDPKAQKKLEAWRAKQARADSRAQAMGEIFGFRDPETGQRVSSSAFQRLSSLAALTDGWSEEGGVKGAVRRFAVSNRANADRARVLNEQHTIARAMHAARAGEIDPVKRREIAAGVMAGQLLTTTAAWQGREKFDASAPGALNALRMSRPEVDLSKADLAKTAGCDAGMVIASTIGAPALIATTHAKGRVIPQLATEEATIEHAKSLINYLPKELTERRASESDEHYHARMVMTMRVAGGMDGAGQISNTLIAHGVDTATVEGRAEVLKASRGEASKLDGIKIPVSAEMRKQIEDGLRSINVPFHEAARGKDALTARTEHATKLSLQATTALTADKASIDKMVEALSRVGSGDQSASRRAVDVIVAQAAQFADQSLPKFNEHLAELKGLTTLNDSPGNENQALGAIARELTASESRSAEQAQRIHELSAQAKLATGDAAKKAVSDLVDEMLKMHRVFQSDYITASGAVRASETKALQALEMAKSQQYKKQLRGANFAGAATATP